MSEKNTRLLKRHALAAKMNVRATVAGYRSLGAKDKAATMRAVRRGLAKVHYLPGRLQILSLTGP